MPLFIWCISFVFPLQMNFPKFTFQLINYSYIFVSWLVLSFINFSSFNCYFKGLPGGVRGKGSTCQCRRCKRHGFDPWVRDICLIPGSGRPSGVGNETHSSILAWKIPWAEEPGELWSMGSQNQT